MKWKLFFNFTFSLCFCCCMIVNFFFENTLISAYTQINILFIYWVASIKLLSSYWSVRVLKYWKLFDSSADKLKVTYLFSLIKRPCFNSIPHIAKEYEKAAKIRRLINTRLIKTKQQQQHQIQIIERQLYLEKVKFNIYLFIK